MKRFFEQYLKRVDFDISRHGQAVAEASISSSKAGFPNFEPQEQYLIELEKRIQCAAHDTRNNHLVLLEDENEILSGLLWLEFLTYPIGFDGDHKLEPWPELLGLYGAQIRNTWVSERYRGRGIASTLKRDAEAIASSQKAHFLYTRCAKSNTGIISLNRKLGYHIIDEDGDYFRMRKLLINGM
tara:strand:- start:3058 stop:3609 length:552 start_codon:yes stop_codon:yes gene_type:complete